MSESSHRVVKATYTDLDSAGLVNRAPDLVSLVGKATTAIDCSSYSDRAVMLQHIA